MKPVIICLFLLLSLSAMAQSSCRYHSRDFDLPELTKNFVFLKNDKIFEVDGIHRTEKVYTLRPIFNHRHAGLQTRFVRIPRNGCVDGYTVTAQDGVLVELRHHELPNGKIFAGSRSLILNSKKDKFIYLGKTDDQRLLFSLVGVTRGGSSDYYHEDVPEKLLLLSEEELGEVEILRSSLSTRQDHEAPKNTNFISHNFCQLGSFTQILQRENKIKYYEIEEGQERCAQSRRNALCLRGAKRRHNSTLAYGGGLRIGLIKFPYDDPSILGIKPKSDFNLNNPLFCSEIRYCRERTNIEIELDYFKQVESVFCQP